MNRNDFIVQVALPEHRVFAEEICDQMFESAKARGTGIAKRSPAYVARKIEENKAVIAFHKSGEWAGFCYIETWSHGQFVANSGLIVNPKFRKMGLAQAIKQEIFNLSGKLYPDAKIFGLTTALAVMKINSALGYEPVTYSELTQDEDFWKGCESCVNYQILKMKERKNCMCTAMLYNPQEKNIKPPKSLPKNYKKSRFVRAFYADKAAPDYQKSKIKIVSFEIVNHKQDEKIVALLSITASSLLKTNIKKMKKVVLAFSGGLDTSFCCVHLAKDRGLEVHSVTVNTGGFSDDELLEIEKRAYALGAASHATVDETENYYRNSIKYLIFGNVLKNATYPLSVSAERVCQATAIANYVKKISADYVAHGSTGAGNDQVRFDMIFNILIPTTEIITPIRDLKLSREEEIEYLAKHGIEYSAEKAKYSINKGLWGTSVGGAETLTSHSALPEQAWPTQVTQTKAKRLELTFKKGELAAVDREQMPPVKAIQKLQVIAQSYGIGRDIHVGDTIIGIKGRVGFEAAGPMVIIKAHHTLEKHTLTKWQLNWKEQLSSFYGNWLHEGQFHDPIMRNIEAFLTSTQNVVSGKVFVELLPYRFQIIGIESPHDLMNDKFGCYGEMNNAWTGEDVKGFSKIFGNQVMIWHKVNAGLAD